jgi:hypothetical protein
MASSCQRAAGMECSNGLAGRGPLVRDGSAAPPHDQSQPRDAARQSQGPAAGPRWPLTSSWSFLTGSGAASTRCSPRRRRGSKDSGRRTPTLRPRCSTSRPELNAPLRSAPRRMLTKPDRLPGSATARSTHRIARTVVSARNQLAHPCPDSCAVSSFRDLRSDAADLRTRRLGGIRWHARVVVVTLWGRGQ